MYAPEGAVAPSALDETWGRVEAFLRARLRPELYDRWFAALRPIPWEAGKVDALKARIGGPAPVAMGDTLGDRELLESATKLRVLVHPRPALRSLALDAARSASLYGQSEGAPWVLFQPPRTVGGMAVNPPTVDRAISGS